MRLSKISIKGESKLIQGHVMDVSRPTLIAAIRSYDPQLYITWNSKKRSGLGLWELRRKPELKSVKEGRYLDTPKGRVLIPGDIFEFDGYTISVPKYHESSHDCIKSFESLDYRILDWVAKQDLWKYGYKGKDFVVEAEYKENKYYDRIEEEADRERNYMIKQHRTLINDFRQYVLDGGDPYRLIDYWGKGQ